MLEAQQQIALEPEAESKDGPMVKLMPGAMAMQPAVAAKKMAAASRPPRKRTVRRWTYRSHWLHKRGDGVNLGGADSVTVVKVQWAAVKANFGPMLVGMHPIAVRDHRLFSGGSFRLVVGRVHSLKYAERLCTRFAHQHISGQPIKFKDGRVIWRCRSIEAGLVSTARPLAKAGTQGRNYMPYDFRLWIPACAGNEWRMRRSPRIKLWATLNPPARSPPASPNRTYRMGLPRR